MEGTSSQTKVRHLSLEGRECLYCFHGAVGLLIPSPYGSTWPWFRSSIFPALRSHWETRGLKVDGQYLCHLCFTDNILICASTSHKLHKFYRN